MNRVGNFCFTLLLTVLITTGCWNLKEPDQLSFVMGNGLDLTKQGKLEASVLIVVPGGIGGGQISSGGKQKSFQVLNATGKNVSNAIANIQAKLSRTVFPGHREVFLVGQRLAEHGFGKTLDPFLRNPQSDMRAQIYTVKNGSPIDVFSSEPLLDPYITSTLADEQKAIGLKPYLGREFVEDALSDATQPLLPVVSLNRSKNYSYDGSAIFNKDDGVKLVGYLNKEESAYASWVKNRLNSNILTNFIPQGKGNISLSLESIDRKIHVKKIAEQIQINVKLTGKGSIIENNTKLDPSQYKDLQVIQQELNRQTQKTVQQLIEKVQKESKMDIFGFGESVHQQYPREWKKTLKQDWPETFPHVPVSVSVELLCNDPGQANSTVSKP